MGTGRRLLLADDSITIQKVVNLTFADEGLDVTAVGNGDRAVEMIEETAPDIVLADVHMPGLNGYEVCEFVKRNERFRHIPVMLLVGSFEPFDEAEARRVGADDYLTKPFQSIRQLVSKVGSLLGGRSSSDETPTKELDTRKDANSEVDAQTGAALQEAASTDNEISTAQEESIDAFADPSLDDAMIETTPVGDFNLTSNIVNTQRETTPLSPADLHDSDTRVADSSSIHTQDTLQMRVGRESHNNVAERASAGYQVTRSASALAAEDGLLDLGDNQPQVAIGGGDEFVLDIWDTPALDSPSSVAAAGDTVVQYDGDVTETSADNSRHVESELYETAPLVDATPVTESENDAVFVEPEADSQTTPPSQTGMITLDQLSPEVIDAIARRAVEQLSEKTVEQIAWEVVPELAERIIRRRLDEERKQ